MKSLRTDDILGAMPRVRHMPKNLYRQPRSYPYTHSLQPSPGKDYDSYYQSMGGKWDHSYNENIYGNFPLSQYDPNPFVHGKEDTNNSGMFNENSYRNTAGLTNGGNGRTQQFSDSRYVQKGERERQEVYSRGNKHENGETRANYESLPIERDVKKKQALYTSYEQLKMLENSKNKKTDQDPHKQRVFSRDHSSPRHQPPHISDSVRISDSGRYSPPLMNPQKPIPLPRTPSQQKEKPTDRNIFRGLGFNIITNSKYQYNVETSVPYYLRRDN